MYDVLSILYKDKNSNSTEIRGKSEISKLVCLDHCDLPEKKPATIDNSENNWDVEDANTKYNHPLLYLLLQLVHSSDRKRAETSSSA